MKLDDTSRKLLRILYNTRGIPSIEELARMSGRNQGKVKMALRNLVAQKYITYDPNNHNELSIIRGWERNPNNWWEK